MATALGLDTNLPAVQAADASYRETISKSIQDLGKRVSEVLKQQQTNRQIQGMARDFGMLNINSPDFPVDMMTVASQYPLAAQSPTGKNGMDLLGLAWSRQQQAKVSSGKTSAPYVSTKDGVSVGIDKATGEKVWQFDHPGNPDIEEQDRKEKDKIIGTYRGSDGKIYTQHAISGFDTPVPEGVRINKIGVDDPQLKAEAAEAKRVREGEDSILKGQIKTDEKTILEAKAANRVLVSRRNQLTDKGVIPGLRVWQQNGKWYRSTTKAMAEGEGKANLKDYATPIEPDVAQQLLAQMEEYEQIPKLIEESNKNIDVIGRRLMETQRQRDMIMGQTKPFDENVVPVDEPLSSPTQQASPVRKRAYNPATRSVE